MSARRRVSTAFAMVVLVSLGLVGISCASISRMLAPPPPPPIEVEATAAVGFNAATVTRIAVLPREQRGWNNQDGSEQRMEDAFVAALMRKNYTVATRSDVDRVIQEAQFQQSSGLTESDAARLGRMLNVQAVLIVSSPDSTTQQQYVYVGTGQSQRAATRVTVSARMVSVERAEILWIGTSTYTFACDRDRAGEAAATLAAAVAEKIPPR